MSNESEPSVWVPTIHEELEQRFMNYLLLAEQMFGGSGLIHQNDHLWERALLKIGDYTLPSGRNYSFLVNRRDDQASWKRLLRGTGETIRNARGIVRQLFDRLDMTLSIESQLKQIIAEPAEIEPWRAALVQTPQAIEYCDRRSYRRSSSTEIYLLSRVQMNGLHAELFTYCLYHNTLSDRRFGPLYLEPYYSVSGTDLEPGIRFHFSHGDNSAYLDLEFWNGMYKLYVHQHSLAQWPELLSRLTQCGFSKGGETASKYVSAANIIGELQSLALHLAEAFPSP